MVLSTESANAEVVVANLTTHDPVRRARCRRRCVVVQPGEHPFASHASCIAYDQAFLTSNELLSKGLANRTYTPRDPLSSQLLARIRKGALRDSTTNLDVKAAIQRDLR